MGRVYNISFLGFRLSKCWMVLLILFLCLSTVSYAQPSNDECFSALPITDLADFCSSNFTTVRATASADDNPSCWLENEAGNDVWYSFTPREEGLLLRFFGSASSNDFTLNNFSVTLYEGRCSNLNELSCRVSSAENLFERVYNSLIIGRTHYIRVANVRDFEGTFQLCLRQFAPIPEPQQDCTTGVVLCDKSLFVVEKLDNGGLDNTEGEGSCLWEPTDPSPSETGSVWYKWTARTTGSLTFTLTPSNDDPEEDLDFAVYRFPGGLNDCDNKEVVLCMASGESLGAGNANLPCFGPTGLMAGDTDLVEFRGCSPGDNNFLAPLNMIAGESYGLLVNNFSESGFGFTIDFGGTGEFLGPEPDFEFSTVDDFECDKTITFENLSTSTTDDIVSLNWRFGEGASPPQAIGQGPHDVIYESFGPKVAVLTVETARGCRVTKTLDLTVDACCNDLDPLVIEPEVQDLSCFESADGMIRTVLTNGSPDFLYGIDGGSLTPDESFAQLDAGSYTIQVLDMKGCEGSTTVIVDQPAEIELTLTGPRDTVDLGTSTQIFSDFLPMDRDLIYMWSPPDGLSCTDCPNPETIPPGTTVYTLTVTDQDGCMQSRDITILTTNDKPIYAPNIISLTPSNTANGFFRIFSSVSAELLEELTIYDRWGGQVYNAQNINIRDESFMGWGGVSQRSGKKVNPGLFIWLAKVRFVDGEVLTLSGDLTVID